MLDFISYHSYIPDCLWDPERNCGWKTEESESAMKTVLDHELPELPNIRYQNFGVPLTDI